MADASHLRHERRVLHVSMGVTATLAVVAVVWGLASNSQVILLDGAYAILGVALTWLSLAISRIAASGPTTRFPFGREALTPLVVVVQGIALLLTLAYAAVEAVRVVLAGGSDIAAGSLIAYGLLVATCSAACTVYVRRSVHSSDLLAAEAAQWASATVFSGVIAVGGGVAWAASRLPFTNADRYVVYALVLVSCVFLLYQPIAQVRGGLLELLEVAPGPEIQEPVRAAVTAAREAHGLPEPDVAVTKLGRKLYVEAVFLVTGSWEVRTEDLVRRHIADRLRDLPYDLWINVELTTDPELV